MRPFMNYAQLGAYTLELTPESRLFHFDMAHLTPYATEDRPNWPPGSRSDLPQVAVSEASALLQSRYISSCGRSSYSLKAYRYASAGKYLIPVLAHVERGD